MKTNSKPTNILLVTLLILSVGTSTIFFTKQQNTSKNLHDQKIKNEVLLSQKLQLDESILNMKKMLNEMKGKNAGLDKLVSEKTKLIAKKEQEIKRLTADNASVSSLKRKMAEMEQIQASLNNQLDQINKAYQVAMKENESLNNALLASQNKNNLLGANNAILRALIADNFRVEAVKGKHDKLTINAKRADKLMISFELAADKALGIKINIIDPQGNEITNDSKAITMVSENEMKYLTANSSGSLGQAASNRTLLVYEAEDKLHKGVYIIKVFNQKEYLGSTQLRLK